MKTVSSTADPAFITEANASGISWAAVIGGAFVTASLWLTLTILGVGLGLSLISPWTGIGAGSQAIKVAAIIWLIVTQIIAASLGGYLAGRWRIKWPTVHTNEVYFRDTAHGFLVWAVAVVVTAAFLGTALSSIVGRGIQMAPMAAPGVVSPAAPGGVRPAIPGGEIKATPGGGETAPGTPGKPSLEQAPQPGPQGTPTPEDLEKARKATAKTSIWIFVALLIGAFCASVAATIGGKQRDKVVYIEVDTGVRGT